MSDYTEDALVQQTTAEYLEHKLGWESVYAYNDEDFGANSLLGRASDHEVVLTRTLRQKLKELEPWPTGCRLRRRHTTGHLHRRLTNPGRDQPREVCLCSRWRAGHLPKRQWGA